MQRYVNEGYHWVVDVDLEKFFDTINHDVLMSLVAKKVRDKILLKQIGRYLRAGVKMYDTVQPTRCGAPQGGPLSPLLGNILLNSSKSKIVQSDESSFLGFTMKGRKIRWTEESFSLFKYTIKKLTGRSNGMSLERRVYKLNTYIRGWMNYYGISQYYRPLHELDGWLRRRLRMCMWKQWRYVRTRVRNLLKLGVPKKMAIDTGISSKSFWHLSRTYGTHFGMGFEWFNDLGLVNIKYLWCKAQGYVV
jgi:RNA-directed DNA polymerase